MVFSSIQFLFYFLPAFLLAYFLLPWKNAVIVVFSLVFYAWGEPTFLPVLLLYIITNYTIGLLIGSEHVGRGTALVVGIVANLALLLYFKYFNFAVGQISMLSQAAGGPPVEASPVALPLGISFIAFQGISYVIDVWRGDVRAQRSLLKFAMYKSLFPQLIAGPIVRYAQIANQVDKRAVGVRDVYLGLRQFILGLAQKVLLANTVAVPADQIFGLNADQLTAATAWFGILCYTLQIFFDFAGYSNMAIGLGRVMGFRLPINFDRPYAALSITEFWRRWHISLSTWFRDYLYIPLGGSRHSDAQTWRNLFIVFVLCGFWHGASWTFALWGLYHGIFLVIERAGFGRVLASLWRPARHLYLWLVVMAGWVLFRADTLPQAKAFFSAMAGQAPAVAAAPLSGFATASVLTAIVAGIFFSTARSDLVFRLRAWPILPLRVASDSALLLLGFLSCSSIAAGGYNPFIYFRF